MQVSSASAPKPRCDVFINHRGTDVKDTLAKAIYDTLASKGLNVCLDVHWLEAGDEIPSELEAAMSSALVHIAIFSENYAQSPWCLAELSFMLKTRATIIPVFYGVEPSDLRWVAEGKGEYVDAFVKHEQKGRYTVEKLAEWKNALHQISFTNGYVMNNNDDEGELVLNKIVNDVLKIHDESLRRLRYHSTEVLGIKYKISEVIKLLQFDDDKPAVGVIVYGIGGAGKTTLANEVYATLNLQGWKHSKVTLIKNMESHSNIEELQTQILSELTGKKHDTVKDYQSGQQELKYILETGDVFVYIDNILSKEHLENLLPKKINSQRRVRILATARKTDASVVFECCGVKPCELYPIESLPLRERLSAVTKKTVLDESKILFAYHELEVNAQEAFLDICSFFSDWEWDEVACIVGDEELQCLQEGALVKRIEVEEYCSDYSLRKREVRRISIHDLILIAGRNKSKGNRFRSADDFSMALENDELPTSLGKLRSLKELYLLDCNKLKQLPAEFGMLSSLTKLVLESRSLQELPRDFQNLSALQSLHLSCCSSLVRLPCDFQNLSALQSLNLSGCSSLVGLPEGLGDLNSLTYINVNECSKLITLPDKVPELSLLKGEISFYWCRSLQEIPEEICKLTMLTSLSLYSCESLEVLPIGFSQLTCLEDLYLNRCECLQELCNDFHSLLRCLERLDLSLCSKLAELSSDFNCLRSVVRLDLSKCESLDGKWMDIVRDIQGLWCVDISGSERMIRQWTEMEREEEKWHFVVITSSWKLEWSSKAWRIIYVGGEFNALPDEVKDRILVYTSPNKDSLFIHKFAVAFPLLNWYSTIAFCSRDGLEEKCPSLWEDISYIVNDDLASLMRGPRASNFEILRALLNTDFLLLKNSQKVPLTDLQGKVVLLLYGSRTMFEHCYLSFEDVYAKMLHSHPHLVEVVSITSDIEDAPWPVVPSHPRWIDREDFFDLLEPQEEYRTSERVVVVDGKGRISNKNALSMIQ
ncbi:hypothetical protein KI387_034667, partial [Taxus chinensis]